MASFKRFAELPRELRDQIWSMAIRDDRPGVHIFGQYDGENDNGNEDRSLTRGDWPSNTWAAPSWRWYFENLNKDRSDENISTYLIDGGLWTACHESRLVMEKRFEQSKRSIYRRPDSGRAREEELFKKATTGYFYGSPLHCVTVFPHRDLFVLQAEDLSKVDWGWLAFEAALASPKEDFGGVRHIAIEYDEKWWKEILESEYISDAPSIWALIDAAFELSGVIYTLWILDRSLRRKKDASALKEKKGKSYFSTDIFYASDRKFVEVHHERMYCVCREWDYVKPLDSTPESRVSSDVDERRSDIDDFSSSLGFVSRLEDELCDRYDPDDTEAERYCHVGLLGWDDL
ncbi:hypothetical protein FOVG_12954 [Fusarium oxysporum f. sp. pisi HDV247]|uniref:2EXR domain-containing protein n=1 Tax=Fusarium oxysporum f. sp. pisi HDV247 TaxID=1080344 RepID=W9NSV8_FUSOX|nr:hypothetical protein FOVG_12954 [Fusarium oxysporum f. sp. pisi HDV247]